MKLKGHKKYCRLPWNICNCPLQMFSGLHPNRSAKEGAVSVLGWFVQLISACLVSDRIYWHLCTSLKLLKTNYFQVCEVKVVSREVSLTRKPWNSLVRAPTQNSSPETHKTCFLPWNILSTPLFCFEKKAEGGGKKYNFSCNHMNFLKLWDIAFHRFSNGLGV